MSYEVEQQISLFRALIINRRFEDGSLRILESVLTSRDLKSLLEARLSLREFMRSESHSVMREITGKTVEQKLLILEFFVRAFALADDFESCMALRYEALIFRELKSPSCPWLQVSSREWMTFVEQCLENGLYCIAVKACEYAMLCIHRKDAGECKTNDRTDNVRILEKIKRFKDVAVTSAASCSVQAQAAEYLRMKTIKKSKVQSTLHKDTQCLASTLFRNGIKKRNARKLHEFRSLNPINGQSDTSSF